MMMNVYHTKIPYLPPNIIPIIQAPLHTIRNKNLRTISDQALKHITLQLQLPTCIESVTLSIDMFDM